MKAWFAGLMVGIVGLVIAFHALAADPLRVKSYRWLRSTPFHWTSYLFPWTNISTSPQGNAITVSW